MLFVCLLPVQAGLHILTYLWDFFMGLFSDFILFYFYNPCFSHVTHICTLMDWSERVTRLFVFVSLFLIEEKCERADGSDFDFQWSCPPQVQDCKYSFEHRVTSLQTCRRTAVTGLLASPRGRRARGLLTCQTERRQGGSSHPCVTFYYEWWKRTLPVTSMASLPVRLYF